MPSGVIGMVFRRYGSTRLPGKGLKLIAGKSMIQLLMTMNQPGNRCFFR